MAVVNKVDIKLKVDINQTVKYQILTYCFFNNILLTKTDLDFLAELSFNPKIEIAKFFNLLTEKGIFKSSQSARNAISKIERKGLLSKIGTNKKTIVINKTINVQTSGLVLLDYKILGNEPKEA
jgi:hypothetical protein